MANGSMNRRDFLAAAGLGAAGLTTLGRWALAAAPTTAPACASAGRKPNIIVIVADDLGYGDLGCQGCKDIPTPNIDALAGAGIRFTDGYVTCPVCSPSRAGMLTGRYQTRFGHEFNPDSPAQPNEAFGLPLSQTTIAERLKQCGYATGLIGKWHQGYKPQFHPQKRGFDEFFGFLAGSHDYLDKTTDPVNPLVRGSEVVAKEEYLTDALAREASAFIAKHRGEPFFLYLAFNAVHLPLQAIEKYKQRFAGTISDPKRLVYAAMLSAMDDAVGTVLAEVRGSGLDDDTLVIFFSDNGGPTSRTTSRNDPLRGGKSTLWEGGIRIPFMARWTGRIAPGQTSHAPVITLDILPTALALAGGKADPAEIDGVNLLPMLTGKTMATPHENLFWRYGPQWAVRSGDWKLLKVPASPAPQLFNLATDVAEQKDLAATQVEKVRQLQGLYDTWNARNVAPLWKGEKAETATKKGAELGD